MPDIGAGGEHQGIEALELGGAKLPGGIVAGEMFETLECRHLRRGTRTQRYAVTLLTQVQGGMCPRKARSAYNQYTVHGLRPPGPV